MVYKLVAIARRSGAYEPVVPVAKSSEGKATRGGVVRPYRIIDDGTAIDEILVQHDRPGPSDARPLHVPLFRASEPAYPYSLEDDRKFHLRVRNELPDSMRMLNSEPLFEARTL